MTHTLASHNNQRAPRLTLFRFLALFFVALVVAGSNAVAHAQATGAQQQTAQPAAQQKQPNTPAAKPAVPVQPVTPEPVCEIHFTFPPSPESR